MKGKIVHICHSEKFIPSIIELINNNFDSNEHLFLVLTGKDDVNVNIPKFNNVITLSKECSSSTIKLIKEIWKYIKSSDKIIIHSLLKQPVVNLLFLSREINKKSYWIVWGDDLYQFTRGQENIKRKIKKEIFSIVVKRLKGMISYLPGDIKLARELFGTKSEYYPCLAYSSNIVSEKYENLFSSHANKIIVGNSASPNNNHIAAFDSISEQFEKVEKVYCPLSYGNQDYAKTVIEHGYRLFGDSFEPITEFMSKNQYFDMLSDIDIAIYAHDRQQGMGNIIQFIAMGKKVYVSSKISTYDLFTEMGVKVFPIEKMNNEPISIKDAENNQKILSERFSKKSLVEQYDFIFKS